MSEKAAQNALASPRVPTFGTQQANKRYTERRAAYAAVFDQDGRVAVVRGPSGRLWLPGGGSLPGESATETLTREIREELARDVRLIHPIGEAIELFYAANDDRHYRMSAAFFRAELGEVQQTEPEYELCWLPADEACREFFHKCHAWAVSQVMA